MFARAFPKGPTVYQTAMLENSWRGKLLRRLQFFVRYCRALWQWKTLKKLEPIVLEHFVSSSEGDKDQKSWVSGARVRLRAFPGWEDRVFRMLWTGDMYLFLWRLLPWRLQDCFADWSAPITVLLTIGAKLDGPYRNYPRAVRYMSLSVKGDVLTVVQLQGVTGTEMKGDLKDWVERFLNAVMEFAKTYNYRVVTIGVAKRQYSYWHPYLSAPTEKGRLKLLEKIQERMTRHHDKIPKKLGWKLEGPSSTLEEGTSWVWYNPNYTPRTKPS
jgi:hypothetical protein